MVFTKLMFTFDVFSIRNFKGNGNAAIDAALVTERLHYKAKKSY